MSDVSSSSASDDSSETSSDCPSESTSAWDSSFWCLADAVSTSHMRCCGWHATAGSWLAASAAKPSAVSNDAVLFGGVSYSIRGISNESLLFEPNEHIESADNLLAFALATAHDLRLPSLSPSDAREFTLLIDDLNDGTNCRAEGFALTVSNGLARVSVTHKDSLPANESLPTPANESLPTPAAV
eukprot:2119639-Prymnesium_polylepis.1